MTHFEQANVVNVLFLQTKRQQKGFGAHFADL
jgi:hypothetical protein